MKTRIEENALQKLKHRAAEPEYGSLRALNEHILKAFLAAKPYREEGFYWGKPPSPDTPGYVELNVIVELALQKRLKAEANRIEVSLAIILLTALTWWLDNHLNEEP